ncbi:hypothetical protein HK101_011402 [Irineochytrium annulatum]|nr:hypothetical protein HK101_011402 [Irineochytrium annulatum]
MQLARAGYMPEFMSYTKLPFTKRQEAWPTLILCLIISVTLAIFAWFEPGSTMSAALGNAGTIYATVSYCAAAAAYIYLKLKCPNVKRPWKLPTIVGTIYQLAIGICAVKISVCFADMWIFHRKHLVLSPEEIFIQAHIRPEGSNIDPLNVSCDAVEHINRSHASLGIGSGVDRMEPVVELEEEVDEFVSTSKPEAKEEKVDEEGRAGLKTVLLTRRLVESEESLS